MSSSELPGFYNGILPWGDRTDRTGEAPKARVGGRLGNPILSASYLLAARRLIWPIEPGDGEQLGVVAFPIVFLQRHAFELALKEFIRDAKDITHSKEWLAALKKDGRNAKIEKAKPPKPVHPFDEILEQLAAEVVRAGYKAEHISQDVYAMAKRLTDIEQGQHTRARYGEFATPVDLELGKVQRDLEDLYDREFWVGDDPASRDSLYAAMAVDADELFQEYVQIESRLGMLKPVTDFDDYW